LTGFKRGRYSGYLRVFLILFDLSVINIFVLFFFDLNSENLYFFSNDFLNNKHLLFVVYSSLFWLITAFVFNFYEVYRYTSILNILSLITKQLTAFTFITFSFMGLFRSISIEALKVMQYILLSFSLIAFMKIITYYALKSFRLYLKGNLRKVVIIGNDEVIEGLKDLFNKKKELGYNLLKIINTKSSNKVLNDSKAIFDYLNKNNVDEVYCSIDDLSKSQINEYVKLASLNHINIKFVPKTTELLSKRLKTEYYDYLPILSISESTVNKNINIALKRGFDVCFSFLVIVFILSWLSVLLYFLLRIESSGPLFYKHTRNGINYKEFTCYKYRTLKTNTDTTNEYVKRNDSRVTKIGRFLRKSSIDELPQFFNVFFGDMSVVGPRPHMLSYTKDYSKVIDKYNFIYRHTVKPGITGLAQVKGYRGEIQSKNDIVNRIKYDNFYIENWSLLLDIKIIAQTLVNIVKGEDKAY